MTAGMLSWEGGAYPSLNLKAWNSRLMLSFFEVVLREMLRQNESSNMDELLLRELRLASAATTAMASFMDQMERAGRYLEPSEARAMDDACHTFLSLYEILILVSLRRGSPRWKAVPKHHSFRHISEDQMSTLLNARYFHSFSDEDFIGVFKRLVLKVPKELLEFRCLTRSLLRLKVAR